MAQTLVNTTSGTNDASATTIAATAQNHASGTENCVEVVWSNNVTCSSVTDTAGNTYVSTGQKASNGTSDHSEIFYAENITGNASNVVTAHFSGSAAFRRVMVHNVSGSAPSGSYTAGQGGTAVATAGSATTSSWTSTNPNAYHFAGFGSSGGINHTNIVAGSGYTKELDDIGTDSGTEQRIVSSTGTYTASYTSTSGTQTWELTAASFVAAGGSTDTFTLAASATGTAAFGMAGMSDRFTFAASATGTASFTVEGTDSFGFTAAASGTAAFVFAGTIHFLFAAAAAGSASFGLAGMSDVFTWNAAAVGTAAFTLVSTPPVGSASLHPLGWHVRMAPSTPVVARSSWWTTY